MISFADKLKEISFALFDIQYEFEGYSDNHNAYFGLTVLSKRGIKTMNGMNYEKVQKEQPTKNAIEEAEFEEMIDAELADDTKPVSTAENELNEFAGKPYEPPKAKEDETEKCVESEEFKTKTDVYEVVFYHDTINIANNIHKYQNKSTNSNSLCHEKVIN